MNNEDRLRAQVKLIEARNGCNWVIRNKDGGLKFDLPYSSGDIDSLKEAKKHIMGVYEKLENPYPPPQPDPPQGIIDNPKPAWMPLMVCDIVDLPFNVGRDYTWDELESLIITLSLAGGDAIRIFATGWEPHIEPFKKVLFTGQYSFFKPNPKWDETLERFADLLHKYHMRLYVDLYDHCSHKLSWNPFTTKKHRFSKGFYGHTKTIKDKGGSPIHEVEFMIGYWDERIMSCLDPKRDIVGLGNELKSHVENDIQERKKWAEKWGVTRAYNILNIHKFPHPVPFSGSETTAQKLLGYISAEEHPEYGWTYKTSCKQVHGLGTADHVVDRFDPSQQRMYSYSDDGVGTNWWNKIPESKQGYCEIRKDGSKYACTANTEERIKCVRTFIGKLGNRTHCHSIAFLPREILYKGKTCLDRFDASVSADVYWELAKELWDVDIRRTRA